MDFAVTATADTLMDLLELRISLETFAAYYAAQRRTDEDIDALRQTIVDMREAKKLPHMDDAGIQHLRAALSSVPPLSGACGAQFGALQRL